MIISQTIDNGRRILHYSDQSVCILQNETGKVYESAVDVVPCPYTYTETDTPITDAEAEEADYLAALEQLGVTQDA